MSVVKRCPNCGTIQTANGECQACHEAHVRYFCTNHEPGVWLDGPTCPQCDARAALPPRPSVSPSSAPVRRRSATLGADVGSKRLSRVDDKPVDLAPARPALWKSLLRSAVLARTSRPAEHGIEPASLSDAGGWLMRVALRFVLVIVLLALALAGGLYWLSRSLS